MSSDKASFLLVFCGLVLGFFLTFATYYVVGPSSSINGTAGNNFMPTAILSSSNKSNEIVDLWLANTTILTTQKLQEEKEYLQNRLREIDSKLALSQQTRLPEAVTTPQNTPLVSRAQINPSNDIQTRSSDGAATLIGNIVDTKQPNASCKYDYKVYVYDIPQSLNSIKISEEARKNQTLHICQKCILEQFALEYIIHDFFTQFCGRTRDPVEADFFYLPLVRDAEFRWNMQKKRVRSRAPSNAEEAILLMIEKGDSSLWKQTFQVTDEYYKKSGGGDHIIVMPAPVTNLRHQSSQRGFFHYMIHLHTPIFLGLEYTVGFIREYPVCSARKNIVMPYPTTDPDLYNGKLGDHRKSHLGRSFLFYYTGGVHGDCVEIRRAMKQIVTNSSRTHLQSHTLSTTSSVYLL
jgi:hypothetical protein